MSFRTPADRESGLVVVGDRYYDPHLARFLTRDPSGIEAGMNLHEYAGDNPASYCDPDGHFIVLISGAIGAGLGAVIGGGIAWYHGGDARAIWAGIGKGALLGGIAGLTGGFAGELVGAWVAQAGGSLIAQGAVGGFAGGIVGDGVQQGYAWALGWLCGFSVPELLGSGATGALLGGLGGRWVT